MQHTTMEDPREGAEGALVRTGADTLLRKREQAPVLEVNRIEDTSRGTRAGGRVCGRRPPDTDPAGRPAHPSGCSRTKGAGLVFAA